MSRLILSILLSNTLLFSISGYLQFSYLPEYAVQLQDESLILQSFETKAVLKETFFNIDIQTELNTIMQKKSDTLFFAPYYQDYIIFAEYDFLDFTAGVSHSCGHPVLSSLIAPEYRKDITKLYIRYNF